jgi:hypothetical protein
MSVLDFHLLIKASKVLSQALMDVFTKFTGSAIALKWDNTQPHINVSIAEFLAKSTQSLSCSWEFNAYRFFSKLHKVLFKEFSVRLLLSIVIGAGNF